jgi:hypothetical protein
MLAIVSCPSRARADDLDEILLARDVYANTEYEDALERFRHFVNRQPPPSPQYVEIARKYIVASLVLTNRRTEAIAVLEQMLRANPDLQFSTRDFSAVVTQLVDETRGRMAAELDRIRREHRERIEHEATERRRQTDLLLARLGQERVTYEVARTWMFLPFGVGQFVNRSYGLGAFFAVTETIGLAGLIATSVSSATLGLPDYDPVTMQCHRTTCTTIIALQMTSLGVLVAAAVAGVVQANMAFVPHRTEYRPRPVPPDIRRLLISGGPTENGVTVTATLRF